MTAVRLSPAPVPCVPCQRCATLECVDELARCAHCGIRVCQYCSAEALGCETGHADARMYCTGCERREPVAVCPVCRGEGDILTAGWPTRYETRACRACEETGRVRIDDRREILDAADDCQGD